MSVLSDNRGITLVELITVMVVLSILAAVAMPMYKVSVKRSKEIELRRDLRAMRDAIDAYKKLVDDGKVAKLDSSTDTGYPKGLDVLVNGVNLAPGQTGTQTTQSQGGGGWEHTKSIGEDIKPGDSANKKLRLLRKIPVDPMTGKPEWGMRSNADEPDSSTWGGQDVFDVYSLSDGVALDGTKYKDW